MRWPSSIWNINLTGSKGKHIGIPLSLLKIREKVANDFTDVGWKRFYNTELFPVFQDFLKAHAEREARIISRTGNLAKSIVIGTGGLGPGKRAFRVIATGDAAKYARIINWGGIIRHKKAAHLTIPFGDNIDEATGGKVIGMRSIKKGEGFTITPKEGSLQGRKMVFLKGDAVERHGFTAHAYPGKGINSRIKPVFELVKYQLIKGTNWANIAQKDAMTEFDTYATQRIREMFNWFR
jgi:hypothetical protein